MLDFNSPTYPYERVQRNYNLMKGAEKIPLNILMYLLDMPDASGYMPRDDNSRPRVRLIKYLWHDGANPLAQSLPTPDEKLSLLYNGNDSVINSEEQKLKHPKGYRIFPQMFWHEAELEARTVLKLYIGRVIPISPMRTSIGLSFELVVNSVLENTTKTDAYSRLYAMECAIIEALHGVNIAGVGVVDFSRQAHNDNGSAPYHDGGTHVYRILNMSIEWQESEII